jgi:hypothetical protein
MPFQVFVETGGAKFLFEKVLLLFPWPLHKEKLFDVNHHFFYEDHGTCVCPSSAWGIYAWWDHCLQ